jgi:ribosomal protein S18 acetylase RimI-like enzyme
MKLLREMQEADIAAVVALITEHEEDDGEEAEKDYRATGGVQDQFVFEDNGEMIGVTGFLTPPSCDRTHWLSWTYVRKDRTNQGYGRTIINELMEYLRQQGGRKLFIKVSDYVSEEGEDIYAAALHLYQSLGFKLEITLKDFYDAGEAQMILGQHLKPIDVGDAQFAVQDESVPIQFNSVYEIAETNGAYAFSWHEKGEALFTVEDVELGLEKVREEGGRAVFLTFPSNYCGLSEVLLKAAFTQAGILQDYYEDGEHEDHYVYYLFPSLLLKNSLKEYR